MSYKNTQTKAILNAFKENGGILTPSQILRLGIAQYNARIKELRDKGYVIENEYLGTVNGQKHTQFTLLSEPTPYVSTPSEKPQDFPTRSHQIAHENRLKNEPVEEVKNDQLTLKI